MNHGIALLRVVHIGLGVYWAGTIFFFVTYLEPSLRALGPDGGKVMFELFKRRYLTVLPAIAGLNILSGFALLWLISDHFNPLWMGSRLGILLTTGAVLALTAFAVGWFVMRTAALRLWSIARDLPGLAEEARPVRMAEMQVLRQRSVLAARIVATLLALAVTAMAVARYA